MDDDLETFRDITDQDLRGGTDESVVKPSAHRSGSQSESRSGIQRLRKSVAVLVFGRYNDVKYAGRDRLAILLRGSTGVVGFAALLALMADIIGVNSGPLWEIQVFVDRLLLQAFAFIGEAGMTLANTPLLTLLVVLALIGLTTYRQ